MNTETQLSEDALGLERERGQSVHFLINVPTFSLETNVLEPIDIV